MNLDWLNKIKTKLHPENKTQFTMIVAGLLIGISTLIAIIMVLTAPKAEKKPAMRLTPVIEVAEIKETNETVVLQSAGVVMPVSAVNIQARISGQIVSKSPEFVEGGIVSKGDILVEIDSRDYQFAVDQKKAALKSAQSELQLEKGRQTVALREWEMINKNDPSGEGNKDLVTRVPQMNARLAAVESAEADLAKAVLNLERAKLTAPFNALVINADADIGDQASPGMILGKLVNTDAYWIQVSIPSSDLQWIHIPGSTARVATSTGQIWNGTVARLMGDLEPQSRMARILLEIKSPLKNTLPLLLNDFVSVYINGAKLQNVCVIPRTTFRDGSEVWLLDNDNILHIKQTEAVWGDRERIFIRRTWDPSLRLVVSNLATPIDGMKLRVAGASENEMPDSTDSSKRKRE